MSKLGEHEEHGEHGEQGKDGKHQPDDLKHSIYRLQSIYMTQNTPFVTKTLYLSTR